LANRVDRPGRRLRRRPGRTSKAAVRLTPANRTAAAVEAASSGSGRAPPNTMLLAIVRRARLSTARPQGLPEAVATTDRVAVVIINRRPVRLAVADSMRPAAVVEEAAIALRAAMVEVAAAPRREAAEVVAEVAHPAVAVAVAVALALRTAAGTTVAVNSAFFP